MTKFRNFFKKNVIDIFFKKFNYKNIMQVPVINKIVINMCVGRSILDKKKLDYAIDDLSRISGQKPYITKVKKSIAQFKIRQGQSIGCKVTLRGIRMWEFFERLVVIAIPRIRDFRGFSIKSFDGRGNYNIGIKEQIIFPEIDYEKIDNIRGLDIAIITSAKNDHDGYILLNALNFPFKKI